MAVQTLKGIVTKAGVMAKTVTMTVERQMTHPKLLKVSATGRAMQWRWQEQSRRYS